MRKTYEKWLAEGWSPVRAVWGLASAVVLVVTIAAWADHAHHPGALWWILAAALVLAAWALTEMARWRIRHNRLQRQLKEQEVPGPLIPGPGSAPSQDGIDPALWRASVSPSGDQRSMSFQLNHRFSERLAVQTFTMLRVTVTAPGKITTDASGLGRIYQYPYEFPDAPPVRSGTYHFTWDGRDDRGGWHKITDGVYEIEKYRDTLGSGERLDSGDSLRSSDGHYRFTVQDNADMIVYDGEQPLSKSDTARTRSRYYLTLREDEELALYHVGGDNPIWTAGVEGKGGKSLVMQSDHNLVLYSDAGPVWSSWTAWGCACEKHRPAIILLPGVAPQSREHPSGSPDAPGPDPQAQPPGPPSAEHEAPSPGQGGS